MVVFFELQLFLAHPTAKTSFHLVHSCVRRIVYTGLGPSNTCSPISKFVLSYVVYKSAMRNCGISFGQSRQSKNRIRRQNFPANELVGLSWNYDSEIDRMLVATKLSFWCSVQPRHFMFGSHPDSHSSDI